MPVWLLGSSLYGAQLAAALGLPTTVQRGLAALIQRTGVDELMVTGAIHDHAARLHSLSLISQIRASLP